METRSFSSNLQVEVKVPDSGSKSKNPTLIERIGLLFTYQIISTCFRFTEDGEDTIESQRESLRIPISDHQISVDFVNDNSDSLRHYLSWSFESFKHEIDAKFVAEKIKSHWFRIRDEVSAKSSHKIFSLTVNLIQWKIERRGIIPEIGRCGMIPASEIAIKEMLEKVMIEENGSDEGCVICLNRFGRDGEWGLKMPCLHIFHGECIEKWLRKSHCCPVCRFLMPTG